MEWSYLFNWDNSPEAFIGIIIALILTDQLVLGRRLHRVERERDEWRDMALRALGVAEKVVHDETTVSSVLKKAGDEMTAEQKRTHP